MPSDLIAQTTKTKCSSTSDEFILATRENSKSYVTRLSVLFISLCLSSFACAHIGVPRFVAAVVDTTLRPYVTMSSSLNAHVMEATEYMRVSLMNCQCASHMFVSFALTRKQ